MSLSNSGCVRCGRVSVRNTVPPTAAKGTTKDDEAAANMCVSHDWIQQSCDLRKEEGNTTFHLIVIGSSAHHPLPAFHPHS